jgi:hypothetical protein
MRNCWLVCFLLGSFLFGIVAWGQSKPAAPPQARTPVAAADNDDDDRPVPPPPSAAAVASDAAVLTIKGLCPRKSPAPFSPACHPG